jgi:hypothetical protein
MTTDNGTPGAAGSEATPLSNWVAFITPFAQTVGKTPAEVTQLLEPIVGSPGEQAISVLKDANLTPDAALKGVFQGVPLGIMNKAISQLREARVTPAAAMAFAGADILPTVPTDESLLSALRAGGVLKIEPPTVISAVRTALANRLGLYDIPELLAKRMEAFADENAEQVSPEFFKLRKQLTRRTYGEIFEAIEGLDGNYVTDARKNALFGRIDQYLWPAIIAFNVRLKAWVESWQQGAASPAMMMNAIAMLAGGGGAMPPGMMQPPDTGALRDAADAFNDDVNKVFGGTGVPVASALAYDAMRIKETLENARLPSLIGAANRDQMLRMLNVEVSATYPRMETNLTKYVLSIMQVKDLAAGAEEQQFFGSLYMLGAQIPWDDLGKGRRTARMRADPGVVEDDRRRLRS